jgi:hypothetical protein
VGFLLMINDVLDEKTGQQLLETRVEKNKTKMPSCRGQPEFRSLKVPQLESRIWDGVKLVLLFIGYHRSGHSLVAALLDAHPNIVLADETRFLTVWQKFTNRTRTRDHLFRLLYERSVKLATKGERSSDNCDSTHIGYKYHVPNQWQGHFDKAIQVGQ